MILCTGIQEWVIQAETHPQVNSSIFRQASSWLVTDVSVNMVPPVISQCAVILREGSLDLLARTQLRKAGMKELHKGLCQEYPSLHPHVTSFTSH